MHFLDSFSKTVSLVANANLSGYSVHSIFQRDDLAWIASFPIPVKYIAWEKKSRVCETVVGNKRAKGYKRQFFCEQPGYGGFGSTFFLSCLTNILLTNGNRVASCATTRNSPNRTRPGEQRGSNPSADGTHKQPTKVSPYCMVMCQTADSVVRGI
jgi:hypothetical protein